MSRGRVSVATSTVLGVVGASAALAGWWLYLMAAVLGTAFALLTIAQPVHGILGFVILGPELSPYAQLRLPSGVPDLTFPRVVIGLVAGAVLLAVTFGIRRLPPPIAAEKAMIVFAALVYLDLYIRSPRFESDALIVFDELVTPFLFFYLARISFRTRGDARKYFLAMVLTGLVLSAHGIYQYVTFGNIGSSNQLTLDERTDTGHVEAGRAAGPFVNSVEFGGTVALAFLTGVLLFLYGKDALARLALLPALGVLGIATVLSLTRSVWLGLLVGILIVAALDRRWRTSILTTLTAAALAGMIAITMFPQDESRLEERTTSMEPMFIRVVMYRAAVSMFFEKPVFGYGRGESTFVRERQPYLTSVAGIPADFGNMAGPPHNVYLFTLLQWGLVGLTSFLAIFYFLVRDGWLLARREGPDLDLATPFAVIFLAGTAVYMIQGVFSDVTAFTFLSNVYFIGAGVFMGTTASAARQAEPTESA